MPPQLDATQGTLRGILDQVDFGTPGAPLSGAALRILQARYLIRDAKGNIIETPRQMFARVARAVGAIDGKWTRSEEALERRAREFFDLMATLKFLPNSPTLMNAGRPRGQLSACFVLPIEDDLGKIFDSLRDSAVIHKTGGGTGFSFGAIRPKGDRIASSGGVASGPNAFLRIFDTATQTVKQGGIRRGANMAILPVDHPDVEEFISSKVAGGIENFNISVGVSDAFLAAVRANGQWALVNPHTREVVRKVRARVLWREIAKAAWTCGDPGVVFLDRVNEFNPTPDVGRMEGTNPCGEQPLLPNESCNLGSINLLPYVSGDGLDWTELARDVESAVRFLDNIIEANFYPLRAIEEITTRNRKIGLGVMGWSDTLMEWGIPYDSDEGVRRGEETMKRISELAVAASEKLAEERGAFPGFSSSRWAKRGDRPRRNATVSTVAPTGTISIIAGVSSGIEPVFSLAFEREALEGERLIFVHPALKKLLRGAGLKARKTLARIVETGSVHGVAEISAKERRVLRTAMEIAPIWHLKMQAAFQRHTENGVSKTINLKKSATIGAVEEIYAKAFELGCKGITVFRDASKGTQVLRKGLDRKRGLQRELLEAMDWLLDDGKENLVRKRASVGMASLSRSQLGRSRRRN